MTVWGVHELQETAEKNNAAPKARADVDAIFDEMGLSPLSVPQNPIDRRAGSAFHKAWAHVVAYRQWKKALVKVGTGDILFLQFPLRNHSLFIGQALKTVKRKHVRLVLLIHDLDYLRYRGSAKRSLLSRVRVRLEEISMLTKADIVICHNRKMMRVLADDLSINERSLVELELFDYLVPSSIEPPNSTTDSLAVAIAGNLSPEKAGYVYELPDNVRFNLYGMGVKNYALGKNSNYFGSFPPDQLPSELKGKFGLVWDGDSAQTCSGNTGNYMRINNPHKLSLYLACGMPVIVWDKAAVADFVIEHGVGITVSSLSQLNAVLAGISNEAYESMRGRAIACGQQLHEGFYTKRAVQDAVRRLNANIDAV